jgi:hypothetical protein
MADQQAKPLTIFALIQVAVILAGILSAGVFSKLWRETVDPNPPAVMMFVLNRGVVLLAIPVLWLLATLQVRSSGSTPEPLKSGLFLFGIVLALGLAAFMFIATVGQYIGLHSL